MHTRNQTLIFILASLMVLLIGGCNNSPADSTTPKASDSNSPEQIEQRFAVFSPAIGVMLQGIGFEDSIVGKHAYDSALGESIPVVGSHIDVDYEMLISIEPTDVFFERNAIGVPERVKELAKAHGWQIWTYKLESLDDIANTVDDLYVKFVGFSEPVAPDKILGVDANPMAKFEIDLPSARLAIAWSDLGRPARDAGRVLLLAGVDPPGALGPESFHGQLLTRLGASLAITDGGLWQELDYEDLIELAPDSILVFQPKTQSANQIGEPVSITVEELTGRLGGIAKLDIPAVNNGRIAIVEHPLGLLPSSSLGQVADEIAEVLQRWAKP